MSDRLDPEQGQGTQRVVVASQNPVKIAAARGGFDLVFAKRRTEVVGVLVESGVADQPRTDAETLRGAEQRAEAARACEPQADFWVGIEGGIDDDGSVMIAFAWVVVLSSSESGRSRTGSFELPTEVTALVRSGVELGEADDRVFGRSNSKQCEGAVGLLTGGVIDRASLYQPSVVLALAPLANPALYR